MQTHRRWLVLALAAAAAGAAAPGAAASKTKLLSPTQDKVQEKLQLDELRTWSATVSSCDGKRCDELGCNCMNQASEFVAKKSDGPVSWLVLFCVAWADRCTKFEKIIGEVAPNLKGLYKIGYIDAEEQKELALTQLGIHVYPTLLAFPRGFGGGHEPLEYDRAKGSPGKLGSWALGLLPNNIVQVYTSDDLFRATSSKQVGVLLFNDKAVTPAGFKAAALRHSHPLAHKYSKYFHFAEVRRDRYAATSNGEDGTDLGELVRKLGPGMDQRQWPMILIIQNKKNDNKNSKLVVWRSSHYAVQQFNSPSIGVKEAANKFYASELELALQAVLNAMPQSAPAAAPQSDDTGGYRLPPVGHSTTVEEQGLKIVPKEDCRDEGPWECFAKGCPAPVVSCQELAFEQKACTENFNLQTMRGTGVVSGRAIRDACRLSCGQCKVGGGGGANKASPSPPPTPPAPARLITQIRRPPPSPPPPKETEAQQAQQKKKKSGGGKVDAFALTGSGVPALADGVFVSSGSYNERPIYRRVPEGFAKSDGQQVHSNLAALYWHDKQSMWVFHSAFFESAGVHGLGHARYQTTAQTGEGVPFGTQGWTCWLKAKWSDCALTLTAVATDKLPRPPPPPPPPAAGSADQSHAAKLAAEKAEIEQAYQKQKAAMEAQAERKKAESAAAARKILDEQLAEKERKGGADGTAAPATPGAAMDEAMQKMKEHIITGASGGANRVGAGAQAEQEQQEDNVRHTRLPLSRWPLFSYKLRGCTARAPHHH